MGELTSARPDGPDGDGYVSDLLFELGIAQVTKITISGNPEVGEEFQIKINGSAVSYTAGDGDDVTSVKTGLVSAINADADVSALVGATLDDNGELTLTAETAGETFSSTAEILNAGSGGSSITLTTEMGRDYSVTVHNQLTDPLDGGCLRCDR